MGISNVNNSNNASSLTSSLLSSASQPLPTLFDYLADDGSSSSVSNLSDVLDISPPAQAEADKLSGSANGTSSGISLDTFQAVADQAFANIQAKLTKLFADKGIDTSKEIKLQVGADGQITVAGDHPQKAQIEQLFKDDANLRDDYIKFTAFSELAAAGQEANTFQAAYAKDPTAAMKQYSYLFDTETKPTLSLTIKGNKYQSILERPGKDAIVVSKSE